MEAEHLTGSRLGIAGIGDAGDYACGLVKEPQRLTGLNPFQLCVRVALGLALNGSDVMAGIFGFRFDHANWLTLDEQDVVGRANTGLPFAYGNTQAGAEIDFLLGLHNPASCRELCVDLVAGELFWILVEGH
ncbi:hypothetical protein [Aeromonas jandaei]|uniref:hypothetical protein n=1 Tax=Aeromonas jandaei TaxID=650 RepID=UPI001C5B3947|nr:hypothetical protein [Aeromonas jandaei]